MEKFQHLEDLSINTSCRACLENLNEMDIHHDIFAKPNLQKKFSACSLLPVEPGDGLPSNLCELCHRRVNDFYIFQQMCISASKRFQDYINLEKKTCSMEIAIDPNNFPTDLMMLTETKSEIEDDYDDPISRDQFPELVKQEPLVELKDQVESSSNNEEDMNFEDNFMNLRSRTEQKKGDKDEKLCQDKVKLPLTRHKFECEICKKKFYKSETFDAHMRVHQGLKAYSCEQCDKSYVYRNWLKEHIKSVHDRKTFQCTEPGCDTIMTTKKSLKQHYKVTHLNKGQKPRQPYICEECGKVLKSLYSLKNHRFIHTGQLPHECPHCDKAFVTKFALKDHLNRHNGIKNFTCPQCGAKKATRSDLRNHIKSHNKDKKYNCPLCDLEFRSMSYVNHHKRTIHEGIKEFPCTHCDRTFATPKIRRHHEMTHTGEKPHECNICHKKFIQPYALKIHKKVHLKNQANEES